MTATEPSDSSTKYTQPFVGGAAVQVNGLLLAARQVTAPGVTIVSLIAPEAGSFRLVLAEAAKASAFAILDEVRR